MKQNKLTIQINNPIDKVFEFVINPKNTHLWAKGISEEKTNDWPVEIGTIYKSHGDDNVWNEYFVSNFEKNRYFELTSKEGNYHVSYQFKELPKDKTEMEYFEWVEAGELDEPYSQEVLNRLKNILDSDL